MDNIIWIILAAAVFIMLAASLMFLSSGVLGDVGDRATEIINTDPKEAVEGSEDEDDDDDESGEEDEDDDDDPFVWTP